MYRKNGKAVATSLSGAWSTSRDNSPNRTAESKSTPLTYKMQGLSRRRAPSSRKSRRVSDCIILEVSDQDDDSESDVIEVDTDNEGEVSVNSEDEEQSSNLQEGKSGELLAIVDDEKSDNKCEGVDMNFQRGTKRKADAEGGRLAKSPRALEEGTPPTRKSVRIALKKGSSQSQP